MVNQFIFTGIGRGKNTSVAHISKHHFQFVFDEKRIDLVECSLVELIQEIIPEIHCGMLGELDLRYRTGITYFRTSLGDLGGMVLNS